MIIMSGKAVTWQEGVFGLPFGQPGSGSSSHPVWALALIQINESGGRARPVLRIHFLKDAAMPLDSILVSVAVVAMFAVFAGVMWWGDTQA